MRILDTHLHLIYPNRFRYPWLSNVPAIDRGWSIEAYFAEARDLGIESALHMEVDVAEGDIEDETMFAIGLPRIVGAIAGCRPESPNFPDQLVRLTSLGQAKLKGLRRILHQAPDELSQSPVFVANLRLLAQYDLPFDLCLRADQLPLGIALAQQIPEVTFVLDHCGNPVVQSDHHDDWRRAISDIAALPNVVGKVSGLANHCQPDWTADTLRPFVEHVIGSFGWDRVVWGSDHPVVTLTGSLTRWAKASREIVAGASADEQAQLFHRNAERVYKV